jgi:hypothetical protein
VRYEALTGTHELNLLLQAFFLCLQLLLLIPQLILLSLQNPKDMGINLFVG